jgi:hypothetical protein
LVLPFFDPEVKGDLGFFFAEETLAAFPPEEEGAVPDFLLREEAGSTTFLPGEERV